MSVLLAYPPVYGPVFQGEGAMIGIPTVFVRTAGCDYRCVWCDTLYAVDAKRYKREWTEHTEDDVTLRVKTLMPERGWVTLSGGNPAIQNLGPLTAALHNAGFLVAVETQGTKAPEWFGDVDHLTLSPKPPSAGKTTSPREVIGAITALWAKARPCRLEIPRVCVKIVVFDAPDLLYARTIFAAVEANPYPQCSAFVLQAGSSTGAGRNELLQGLAWLEEQALHLGVRVLPQLHAVVHGSRRDG